MVARTRFGRPVPYEWTETTLKEKHRSGGRYCSLHAMSRAAQACLYCTE